MLTQEWLNELLWENMPEWRKKQIENEEDAVKDGEE